MRTSTNIATYIQRLIVARTAWFLPEDGDVLVGTPDGRTILLGGLSPLTLPGVVMAPCLSMAWDRRRCVGCPA